MARTRLISNSFNSGEWSPRLAGRTDLEKYRNAVATMENCYCFKHGGATRRPGTRFVAETRYSNKESHLLRFEFSTVQAYIIEMGDLYARFYKDDARIESPPGTPVTITIPYAAADIGSINFTQSADVLYLAHGSYAPEKLTRTSHTAWSITPLPFTGGPWLDEDATITITASATTGPGVTLLASSALFLPGHVGSLWRIMGAAVWGYVRITAVADTLNATCDVVADLDAVGPSVSQAEGAWNDVRGWPACVTLFQQRLWFGNTTNQPDTFWGSQTSDYENFDPGTAQDNEACTFTLASNRVNAIRWMVPSRALLIGTTGQEWQATGGDVTIPITPANITAKAETPHGSGTLAPVQVQNVTLFLQKAGRKIREFSFDFASDSYQAPDVSILAEHITDGGIVDMDYQQELDSLVWLVRADGVLVGMTYERQQDVIGWHRHITGTAQDMSDGKFESVAVIPIADQDQVWCIVNRTIGGVTKRYVEFLDTSSGFYGALNVDCGLTYSGVAASTLSGLSHLEGQVVDVVGNGAVYPQKTVSGGQITGLSPMVTQAEVGLHYPSKVLTLRPEGGADSGTSQGSRKRWSELFVRLYQSIGVTLDGDTIPFRSSADPMNQSVALFTGDKRISHSGWDREGQVTIEQKQPLPFTLLALFGVISVND